jgi:hypothetical protein
LRHCEGGLGIIYILELLPPEAALAFSAGPFLMLKAEALMPAGGGDELVIVVGFGGSSDSATDVIARLFVVRPGEGELVEGN